MYLTDKKYNFRDKVTISFFILLWFILSLFVTIVSVYSLLSLLQMLGVSSYSRGSFDALSDTKTWVIFVGVFGLILYFRQLNLSAQTKDEVSEIKTQLNQSYDKLKNIEQRLHNIEQRIEWVQHKFIKKE